MRSPSSTATACTQLKWPASVRKHRVLCPSPFHQRRYCASTATLPAAVPERELESPVEPQPAPGTGKGPEPSTGSGRWRFEGRPDSAIPAPRAAGPVRHAALLLDSLLFSSELWSRPVLFPHSLDRYRAPALSPARVPTDFRIAHKSNETRTKDYKKKRDRAPVQIRMGQAASNGPFRPNRERAQTSEGGLWSDTPRHTHMPSSSKMSSVKSCPNGNPFL